MRVLWSIIHFYFQLVRLIQANARSLSRYCVSTKLGGFDQTYASGGHQNGQESNNLLTAGALAEGVFACAAPKLKERRLIADTSAKIFAMMSWV